eukprot:13572004-Alexandrium_andersonii.AAC.1
MEDRNGYFQLVVLVQLLHACRAALWHARILGSCGQAGVGQWGRDGPAAGAHVWSPPRAVLSRLVRSRALAKFHS